MCCTFSLDARKKPALAITILSVLIIISGLVMLILSIFFVTNQDDIFSADFDEMKDQADAIKSTTFGVLLTFSLIALFVGIGGATCGCPACATGNRIFPVLFGIPLMIVWLVFVIMGGVVTTISASSQETIQSFCDGNTDESLTWLSVTINEVDGVINSYSSSYMCSSECPCDTDYEDDWTSLSNSKLAEYGRSSSSRLLQSVPSSSDDETLIPLVFNDGASNLVYNFTECNTLLQEKKQAWTDANPTDDDDQNPYSYVPSGPEIDNGIAILSYFEGKYTCSGVCSTALFYYSLDLIDGVPDKTCLTFLKDEIGSSLTYLGVTSLICGILCLLIFVCQYALWCRYQDEEEPKSLYSNNRD